MKSRVIMLGLTLAACGADSEKSDKVGSGGEMAAGGRGNRDAGVPDASDSGGSTSAGGQPGPTGGSSAAGGSRGDGGASGTGGAPGSGGSPPCDTPCGSGCCTGDAVCVDDGAGNLACAEACLSNTTCPPSRPVCTLLEDGTGACTVDIGGLQRCLSASACASGACAPNVDGEGNPVGPYVCAPNDGAAYHGCHGFLTSCGSSYCCFTDTLGNQFCATSCLNDTQCGAAHCVPYDNSNTTCSTTLGCGP
jgi:hypothetical protein